MEVKPPCVCLFCGSSTNTFSSVEHIFPESLGNKEKILPKGVVCDKCNNGILSTLDQCLADFDLIKFFRTHHGVESKTGKVPEAKFGDMDMKNPSKNHVIMRVDKMSKQFKQDEDGFTVSWRGAKPMTAKNLKRLARALYKIGLELICLDHGSSFALSSRFDETREIVLGKKDFEGYRLVGVNEVSVDPGVILLDEERK